MTYLDEMWHFQQVHALKKDGMLEDAVTHADQAIDSASAYPSAFKRHMRSLRDSIQTTIDMRADR